MFEKQIGRIEKGLRNADNKTKLIYTTLGVDFIHDQAVELWYILMGVVITIGGVFVGLIDGDGFSVLSIFAWIGLAVMMYGGVALPYIRHRQFKNAKT